MGRPRKIFASPFALVTHVDKPLYEKVSMVCRREKISVRKLLRSLVQSYIDDPVWRLLWRDPVVYENADPKDYHPAIYETIGWLNPDTGRDEVGIIWLRRSGRSLLGEQKISGPTGIVLPKGCVVELRRASSL